MMILSWYCIAILAQLVPQTAAYKTVVLVHGLNNSPREFNVLQPRIEQAHPGTNVVALNYSPDRLSLDPILVQLKSFEIEIGKVLSTTDDDVHLVCHSQGGVVCMGYIMLNQNHRVHTFMVLSSPVFGQYGLTADILKAVPFLRPFKDLVAELVSELVYTDDFQNSLSIANYWRDPRTSIQEKYERVATYFPIILNDPMYHKYNATEANQRKKNFLRLNQLVLLGGPDDEIIKPWQSPLFGYYDENEISENIINMTHQKVYTEDWFGLRTLHEEGRLERFIIPGILHGAWVTDESVFKNVIIKWLV